MKKKTLIDSLTVRVVKASQKVRGRRVVRILGGRGVITLLLGTALSIGGLTDAVSGVHFLVQKDLDSVRVVREKGKTRKVVASVEDRFAANSLFKVSQIFPDRLVSRELALFDEAWFPRVESMPVHKHRDAFQEEMARINATIRREFFANAMPFGDLIHEKAEKYDVDPALVAAVIEAESRFKRTAQSPVGAKGLMQLMPRTGRWMGANDLYDAEQNVDAGVKYIKYLQKRFGGNLTKTIAAYNAGEGNVQRYGGVPPFRETQTYVKRVMRNYKKRNDQLKSYGEDQQRDGGGSTFDERVVAAK